MANQIEGLDKLIEQLTNLKSIDVVKTASAGGYKLLKYSQDNAPYKTGFLKNSGYVEPVSGEGCNMVFGADYAFYVEMGTSKWEGHPFIRPAIDEKSNEICQAMADEAQKQIKEKI